MASLGLLPACDGVTSALVSRHCTPNSNSRQCRSRCFVSLNCRSSSRLHRIAASTETVQESCSSGAIAVKLTFLTVHPNGRAWEHPSVMHRPVVYNRLLPCPFESLPPRVEHLVVLESGNVVDLLTRALSLPQLYVEDLVDFGAIHYALLCPSLPVDATHEQLQVYARVSSLQDPKARPSCRGKTAREAQKTRRVTSKTLFLEAGSYLRVHVHPKRFARCYETNWKQRVLEETNDFVVLDKPAGVPVGGTVDNLEECCATFITRVLDLSTNICITHQIDNGSEGCVVLAKTNEYAARFCQLMRAREVKKVYRALATAPVPLGRLVHYTRPDRNSPRLLSLGCHLGWQRCEMIVLSCVKVPWPSPSTLANYRVKDCGWKEETFAYELRLELITGRTHQVRLQCASVGAPLLGDSMYIPAVIARLDTPDIDPVLNAVNVEDQKSWVGNVKDRRDAGPMERWIAAHGREPECAIGLQAYQISWTENGQFYRFEAGPPGGNAG